MSPHDLGLPRLDDVGETEGFLQVAVGGIAGEAREDGGIDFRIRITADTPALPSPSLKSVVHATGNLATGAAWARSADAVRESGGSFSCSGADFALRHASAGAIVRVDRGDTSPETLLFLRDIHPEGWNIANGASGSRAELSDIEAVLRREVEEELMFLDGDRLLVVGDPARNAELAAAVRAWRDTLDVASVETIPLRWTPGPDTLTVTDTEGETTVTTGLHVVISVEDFGLECARVATVAVPPSAVPVDGELHAGRLLDRPVGLFAGAALAEPHPRPRAVYRGGRVVDDPGPHPPCPITRRLIELVGA